MSQSSFPSNGELPSPRLRGQQSLEETLSTRRTARKFTDAPLTNAEISQLLWAAQGVTDASGLRTAPSAGALYPLELYVAGSSGLHRYDPTRHQLTQCLDADPRQAIHDSALAQDAIIQAPVVFVVTAIAARTRDDYGARTERYVAMEAGRAAQNLLLQAVALNLACATLGAFNDDRLSEVLGLADKETPLYLIPIGHSQA